MQSNNINVTGELQTIYIDMKNMFQSDEVHLLCDCLPVSIPVINGFKP